MKYLLSVSMILCLTVYLRADIIHIPGDQPTIQAGISAASDGDTVLVAEGIYIENINYLGKAITVASHFLMDGDTSHISATVIDGSQPSNPDSGSVVTFNSGEDTTAVLAGFTITGGSGTISEYIWQGVVYPARGGGGIFCYNASARISHNQIRNNNIPAYVESWGGGIAGFVLGSTGYLIIEDNKIDHNGVTGTDLTGGGGIALYCSGRIVHNMISHNAGYGSLYVYGAAYVAADPAGSQSALVKDNRIIHNTLSGTYVNGTGLTVGGGTSASVVGNNISYNEMLSAVSASNGGGLMVDVAYGTIDIDANTIVGNVIYDNNSYGGGISLWSNMASANNDIRVANNIVSGNEADYGGGIRCQNSTAQMINNTVVDNFARVSGGGIRVDGAQSDATILNSIFWGNTAPQYPQIDYLSSGAIRVHYSDVQGGYPSGMGNIDADPFFADTLFNLSDSSSCIGAGIDSIEISGIWYHAPPFDYNGNPRPNPAGSMPDIGAQESPLGSPVAIEPIGDNLPVTYELRQNYPNPFNPSTTIEFALPHSDRVTLKVYNLLGQEVAVLVAEDMVAGTYKYEWDAGGLASGVYYYSIKIDDFNETKKMLLIR